MIVADDLFVLHRGAVHDVVALRGLNLVVKAGERVVVQGPSGSGKSTLVRVLMGDLIPSAGRAEVLGHEVTESGQRSRQPGVPAPGLIGVVTQGTGQDLVPELTCLQNVALQARLLGHRRRDAEVLAAAALDRFGAGLLAARRPATLSNGEAQCVGIAAALVCSPRVIIADEPTGELDRASADLVYKLLAEQATEAGAALLLVTHDARAAAFADRTVTIRDGRVSEERIGTDDRLIVDTRGWVRLPYGALRASGITDRVRLETDADRACIRLDAPLPAVHQQTVEDNSPRRNDDEPLEAVDPIDPLETAGPFVVSDVTVSVGPTRVLAPVSLRVNRGFTVIAGPSGCGKTTLLGLLAGFSEPDSGTISRPDAAVSFSTSLAGFAETLGVAENIDLARAARGLGSADPADVQQVLCALGIEHLGHRELRHLSGGERQRAGIARALCGSSPIVLLDEPTSQLDEASARVVAEALFNVGRSRTVVCSSHDEALIGIANQVIRLG